MFHCSPAAVKAPASPVFISDGLKDKQVKMYSDAFILGEQRQKIICYQQPLSQGTKKESRNIEHSLINQMKTLPW